MQNGIKQKEKTSINNLTYIVGNIKAEEHLIINGKLKGNIEIRNHNFFLGPSGYKCWTKTETPKEAV